MLLTTRNILVAMLVIVSWSASAQTSSPTERMVQSMGIGPALQANIQQSLADPAYVQRTNRQHIALGKKLVNLSKTEFNALIARVLEAGLSPSDITTITTFYQTKLGQKLSEQAQQGKALPKLNDDLSASDRQALDRYASSGVVPRVIHFLEGEQFERAFLAELENLPSSPTPIK